MQLFLFWRQRGLIWGSLASPLLSWGSLTQCHFLLLSVLLRQRRPDLWSKQLGRKKTRAQIWLFRHWCNTLLPSSRESERRYSFVQVKGYLGNGDSSGGQDLCVPVMLSPLALQHSLYLSPAGTGEQNGNATGFSERSTND